MSKVRSDPFTHVGRKGIKLAVGYASTLGRDVSGLFDLVRDARRRAKKAGDNQVTYEHLQAAYDLDRVPCENALAEAFPPQPKKGEKISREEPEPSTPPEGELQAGFNRLESPVQHHRGRAAVGLVTA